MPNLARIVGVAVACAVALGGLPADPVRAQLTGELADEVAKSTVMLSALLTKTENGVEDQQPYQECFLGSGSVVSDDGRFILTNSHVVDGMGLAGSFAETETADLLAESPGRDVGIQVAELSVWVVDHDQMRPFRRYRAEVVRDETRLDLALLRITGDSLGIDHAGPLDRPHLELGDSAGVWAVTLSGYPAPALGATDDPNCVPVPDSRPIRQS